MREQETEIERRRKSKKEKVKGERRKRVAKFITRAVNRLRRSRNLSFYNVLFSLYRTIASFQLHLTNKEFKKF